MKKGNSTLAIYGIQDRDNYPYPFFVHDHNMAFMNKGKIEWFVQQERISRKKRDNTLYVDIKKLLKQKKLINGDYDLVFVDNVVGRTFLSRDGDVRFEGPLDYGLATDLEKGKCWWFGKEKNAYVINHELAHIFSCLPFFGNFKENSLLVHYDGGASLSNFSAAIIKNGKIVWVDYNWKLKKYSSIYNANALVFSIVRAKLEEQNSVPGKFMGFAGWGQANEDLKKWLVKNDFFQNIWGKTSYFFKKAKCDFGVEVKSFNQKDPFIQNVAASLQELFIENIIEQLKRVKKKTGAEKLYYTGGSALNIVANTKIIESNIFDEVFIPPCTEDSGLAIGAAAFMEWRKYGEIEKCTPYLNNWNIESYKTGVREENILRIAELIAKGRIIGICNGYGEAGPRALGNRSILAIPSSKKIAKLISVDKKQREWYRPLAPVALEKNIKFFTGLEKVNHLSKYMLLDFNVLIEKRKMIEGVIHANGTTRFQTIFNREQNPFIYELLKVLDEKYNIKALINTSFNCKGEPIVHTREDAINAAEKMKLDALVINGELILNNG